MTLSLAGTEVKNGHAGIEIFDQEALNGAMQRGTLRRLALLDIAAGIHPHGTCFDIWRRLNEEGLPMVARSTLMFMMGLLAASCAAFEGDRIAGAWKGHPLDDLILDWGPPAAHHVTSDGRQTATFSHSRFAAGTQFYCNATFGTDANGIIVSSQVDGNLGGCNVFFQTKRAP